MENDIIIANKQLLDEKIQKFKEDGVDKVHIVSDFDKTLTHFIVNEEEVSSVMLSLRKSNYLTPDYATKAEEIQNKFYPLQIDPNVSIEVKKSNLLKWWDEHYKLLGECGLSKKALQGVVDTNRYIFRDGYQEFFKILDNYNIPLTIVTANGLGEDIIKMIFDKFKIDYGKINLIANKFVWDNNGNFVKLLYPIVNTINKDDAMKQDERMQKLAEQKCNIILIGDREKDLGMAKNIKYKNIIKVGYLNEKEEELFEEYSNKFDIVITNDQGLETISNILKRIAIS